MRATSIAVCSAIAIIAAAADLVSYPQEYREWMHVKSAVLTPSHPSYKTEGDLHHIYANKAAIEGYRTGVFPDGAVIAYELLETREAGGVVSEGPRRRLDVMVKNRKLYAATGGWGFERFPGEGQTEGAVGDNGAKCFGCHQKQEARDFVFSTIRE